MKYYDQYEFDRTQENKDLEEKMKVHWYDIYILFFILFSPFLLIALGLITVIALVINHFK